MSGAFHSPSGELVRFVPQPDGTIRTVPLTPTEIEALPRSEYALIREGKIQDTVQSHGVREAEEIFNLIYPGWQANGYQLWLRIDKD